MIIIGDETGVCHVTTEGKQQSLQWRHTGSQKGKNARQLVL